MCLKKCLVDLNIKESKFENALHYKILSHYEKKDIKGNADIYFRPVAHYKPCKYPSGNCLYKDCKDRGFNDGDIVSHLKFFYPNGGIFLKEYMRNGTGTFVLNRIISDTLNHNGKMLYVFSTTDFMDSFLNKKRFIHSSEFESQFYLDL